MGISKKIESKEFLTLAEIIPPKGVDVSQMLSKATALRELVDAFLVPDMSNAVMHMSALGAAIILQQNGMEAVMQISCRDRNRLALQADLLASYACGVNNIMAVTTEDTKSGDHHETKPVDDVQLLDLLEACLLLQKGKDMAGIDLEGSPTFLVGSTVNAAAKGARLDRELEEINKKKERGVAYFVTPPVFALSSIESFLKAVDRQKINIIPTVLLLKSAGMARYIDTHSENIRIPEELIVRIQKASNSLRECMKIAAETVSTFKKEGFCGVAITALGLESRIVEILEEAS